MSGPEVVLLVLAGLAAGLAGSIAGLASLISYPALLAAGLPPVSANVTNTVSLVFSGVGSVLGSGPELRGARALLPRLCVAGLAGGITGGGLLLLTPPGAFARLVPWLIGLASLAMLVPPQRGARRAAVDEETVAVEGTVDPVAEPGAAGAHLPPASAGWPLTAGVFATATYGGYFGAAAGVLMLALLLASTPIGLARSNAVKNLVLGLANGVAAVAFVFFGPVHWAAVPPLGIGFLIGGRIGPAVVRRTPAGPLRVVIALAGVALAARLGVGAY